MRITFLAQGNNDSFWRGSNPRMTDNESDALLKIKNLLFSFFLAQIKIAHALELKDNIVLYCANTDIFLFLEVKRRTVTVASPLITSKRDKEWVSPRIVSVGTVIVCENFEASNYLPFSRTAQYCWNGMEWNGYLPRLFKLLDLHLSCLWDDTRGRNRKLTEVRIFAPFIIL